VSERAREGACGRGGIDWRLVVSMEKVRSWYVESKSFEMMIKGGNYGLRMVEKGKKKQGSIFIRRDEIGWLVGAVEVALDVETSEVFWDPSSAGFPRVLVQRRANMHGNFIFIEEYEGRRRRGSALIPEGRYGQGWSRLLSELKTARSALWKGREFRTRKESRVISRRSYAEAVGRPQSPVVAGKTMQMAETSEKDGGCAQTRPKIIPGKIVVKLDAPKGSGETGDTIGAAPVSLQGKMPETRAGGSGNPKPLQDPMKSGLPALNRDRESEGSGHASLLGGFDLQEVTKFLTDIRGQLVLGLKRVEEFSQKLEMSMGQVGNDANMGLGENNNRNKVKMGNKRSNEEMGWYKPKKKNFRRISTQPGVLGPKPNTGLGQSLKGPAQFRDFIRSPAQQVGEASSSGTECRTGDNGLPIDGDNAGEHLADAGVSSPTTVKSPANITEAESAGVLIGGLGREEEEPTQRLGSDPEVAEELGSPLSTPERCSKVAESWRSMLSTIPETVAELGPAFSPPEKSSNRVMDHSENAGEVESHMLMPAKQSKQLKIFQRRESPSKSTKSWVAERVSWNGSRGCDMTTIASSGKNHNSCLVSEEQSIKAFSVLGNHEEQGMLGGIGTQENETPGVEGINYQCVGKIVTEEQLDQGLGSDSPVSRDLNMVWKVKGTAGLSWGGQDGKLKQVFGQIVASKYEDGTSSALGEEADGFKGMRDDDIPYEA
jgi:hypothetical protein